MWATESILCLPPQLSWHLRGYLGLETKKLASPRHVASHTLRPKYALTLRPDSMPHKGDKILQHHCPVGLLELSVAEAVGGCLLLPLFRRAN